MDCKFKQMRKNRYTDCDGCCYNPSAYLEDSFEWNGEGKEPTEEELDDAIK